MKFPAAYVAALGLVLSGCGKKPVASPPPSTSEAQADGATPKAAAKPAEKADHVKLLLDGFAKWNTHDLDGAFATFDDHVVRNAVGDPAAPKITTREQLVAYEGKFQAALPDARMTVQRVFDAKDWTLAQVVISGTAREPPGAAGIGKPIGVASFVGVHWGETGKVDRMDVVFDTLTFLRQLGKLPDGGEAPKPVAPDAGEPEIVRGEGSAEHVAAAEAFCKGFTNAGFKKAMHNLYADDFVFVDLNAGSELKGLEANIDYLDKHFFSHLADWTSSADLTVAVGDWGITWVSERGTYDAGDGQPPRKLTLHSVDIGRWKHGKIAYFTLYQNGMEGKSQLEPEGVAAEKEHPE